MSKDEKQMLQVAKKDAAWKVCIAVSVAPAHLMQNAIKNGTVGCH